MTKLRLEYVQCNPSLPLGAICNPAHEKLRLEYVRCNLCGGDDTILMFVGRDRELKKAGEFRVVKCRRCGLIYVNPRPDTESLKQYYTDEYAPYKSEAKGLIRVVKNWLYRREAMFLRQFLPAGARLLDVGCGSGEFTAALRDFGQFETVGVEPSAYAADTARKKFGLDVRVGTLEECAFNDGCFDIVVMKYVLEHLPDPHTELLEVRRVLSKGGWVVLWVPNVASVEANLFGARWHGYDVPRHLYTFSTHTLTRLLCKAGFTVERMDFSGVPNDWVRGIRYWFSDRGWLAAERWATVSNPLLLALCLPCSLITARMKRSGRVRCLSRLGKW